MFPKMGSTLIELNLLLQEQIQSLKRWPLLKREATMKYDRVVSLDNVPIHLIVNQNNYRQLPLITGHND